MNIFHGAHSVDRDDHIFVVVDKGFGFGAVDGHTVADDIFGIVCAPTSQHALDNSIFIDLEFHHRVEGDSALLQHFLESIGLFYGAGEAVQQEAVLGVSLVKARIYHAVGEFGRHQVSGVHVALGFQT